MSFSRRVHLGSATQGLILALAVFVLGVGVVLRTFHWFDLNHWREPIQAHLSEALGQEVKLGSLELRMEALAPRIIIHNISLRETPDRFQVKRLDATLALRALWGKQLKLKRLELDGMSLEVVRWSAQRYRIAGREIDLTQSGESKGLAWLLDQPGLTVSNSRLVLRDLGAGDQGMVRQQVFEGVNVLLRNRLRSHQLKVESQANSGGAGLAQKLEVIVDAQSKVGEPKLDWQRWHIESYAKLDGAVAEQVKPFVRQWTGLDSPLSAGLVSGLVNGRSRSG
jgi:uncharacterized protein involved in outer membrane biogenesis